MTLLTRSSTTNQRIHRQGKRLGIDAQAAQGRDEPQPVPCCSGADGPDRSPLRRAARWYRQKTAGSRTAFRTARHRTKTIAEGIDIATDVLLWRHIIRRAEMLPTRVTGSVAALPGWLNAAPFLPELGGGPASAFVLPHGRVFGLAASSGSPLLSLRWSV